MLDRKCKIIMYCSHLINISSSVNYIVICTFDVYPLNIISSSQTTAIIVVKYLYHSIVSLDHQTSHIKIIIVHWIMTHNLKKLWYYVFTIFVNSSRSPTSSNRHSFSCYSHCIMGRIDYQYQERNDCKYLYIIIYIWLGHTKPTIVK